MNMSHCRFENTAIDLKNCLEAIRNGEAEEDQLSEEEKRGKKRLVVLCRQILDEVGEEDEDSGELDDDRECHGG